MTPADCSKLLARHLRLHANILALRRCTVAIARRFPRGDWPSALAQRRPLIQRLRALDPPALAAATEREMGRLRNPVLAARLRTLHQRGITMMQRLLLLDEFVQAAFAARLHSAVQGLRRTGRARSARTRYQHFPRRRPRLDHRG